MPRPPRLAISGLFVAACGAVLGGAGIAAAQPITTNRGAIRPFFDLARVARVDMVGIGDSNQLLGGHGWDEGWHVALGNTFGEYATGVVSLGENTGNGSSQGYRYGCAPSGASGQFAFTGAPAELNKYLNNPPSLLGPNNYLYVAAGAIASGAINQGLSLDSTCPISISGPLRFHYSYGLFTGSGAGNFQPFVRFEEPPYEAVFDGGVTSTRTGDASPSRMVFASFDLPAAPRTRNIAFRATPYFSAIVGPFITYYARCENLSTTHGAAVSSLYAVGSQSARDMAQAINLSTDEALTLYFTHIRMTQGADKAVLVTISTGLNDRSEDLPSVGHGVTPGNSAAAFTDNIQFIITRLRAVWTLNNWPATELYFLLAPSHPVEYPDTSSLVAYRNAAEQIALNNPRTACIRLDRLTIAPEMLANGWYNSNGSDRNHLTRPAYIALAERQLLYLLKPQCPSDFNSDGGIDGQDVQAFFEAWESGDFLSDVNDDGGVDGWDVGWFIQRWVTGEC